MHDKPWLQTSAAGRRIAVFMGGGVLYSLIEVVYRGYTHWTMTLTGGICLLIMYLRYTSRPNDSIVMKCFFGMCVITFFEFTVGCVVNILMGWGVWDYSHMYLNLLGQICPSYSGAWFLLSYPVALACSLEVPPDNNAADGKLSENFSV